MEAAVPPNIACGPEYTIVIQSTKSQYLQLHPVNFTIGKHNVQRLIDSARVMVGLECPEAKTLKIIGIGDFGDTIYRGTATEANNWELVDVWIWTPVKQEPEQKQAWILPGHAVIECDKLAAHPDDPAKTGTGVADDHIETSKAIAACQTAVQAEPDNARLRFQLGRAYWVAGRFEEAIEAFLEAGEQGHGGALAYMGDAALYGVADLEPDPATAKSLYQRAAQAGFKSAEGPAKEIVAGAKVQKQQVAEEAQGEKPQKGKKNQPFEPQYHHPEIIAALANGIVKSDRKLSERQHLVYIMSLAGGVDHHCPSLVTFSVLSPTEIGIMMVHRFGFFESFHFNQEINEGVYQQTNQEGVDDGYAFVSGKDCKSPEVKMFARTISEYFEPRNNKYYDPKTGYFNPK